MQHVCGLKVTGLLKAGMSYSHYWNEKGVTQVDAMRSPLTYLSEHVILNLQKDDDTEKWYRYCKLGIILNYHGHETFHFAGSDFDMDILATTSNSVMINGVYKDELPVLYNVPKPEKCLFTEDDLYHADTFSFGSIIGSITNKSSNAYALLPIIEETYGADSQEYRLLKSRLQQCCKAQSAQIDKAKIGRAVKGIPQVWTRQNKIKKNKKGKVIDCKKRRKELYNSVLLNTYPYFFRYVYKDTERSYKKYLDEYNILCKQKFRTSFSKLETLENRTEEQEAFIQQFYRYCPVIISKSPMNLLCRYIETIDFQISQKTKADNSFPFECYKNPNIQYTDYYENVISELKKFMKELKTSMIVTSCEEERTEEYSIDKRNYFSVKSDDLYERLSQVNKNPYVILNCLIDYFYIEKPTASKELLWKSYGKFICKNIMTYTDNTNASVFFPMPTEEQYSDLQYLGYHYKLQEVQIEL